eukprot:gene5539-17506_t
MLSLNDYVKDPATRAVLGRLFELMALQLIHESCGDWMDVLDSKQVDLG